MHKVTATLFSVILLFFIATMPTQSVPFQDGLDFAKHNQLEAAAQAFTEAIDRGDRRPVAYSNRCLVQLKLEDYPAAIADCSEAIKQTSTISEAYLNRGLAYHRLEHYASAIADYDRLLSTSRQDFRGYYNRGLSKVALAQLDSAIEDFKMAERFSRQESSAVRSQIFNDWGLALFLQRSWTAAYTQFDRAIRLAPQLEGYYFNRGCTCHRLEEYSCALKDFTSVVQLNPQAADAYVSRGMVQARLGEVRRALGDWNMAAALFAEQHNLSAQAQVQNLLEQIANLTSTIA